MRTSSTTPAAGVDTAAEFAASLTGRFGFPKLLSLPIIPVGVLGVNGSGLAGPVHPEKSSGEPGVTATVGSCFGLFGEK